MRGRRAVGTALLIPSLLGVAAVAPGASVPVSGGRGADVVADAGLSAVDRSGEPAAEQGGGTTA